MQYAFARVMDRNASLPYCILLSGILHIPQSQLPKFVQINWCGDGVPEARKGLFYSHSTAVANFLKGSHVVISARNDRMNHENKTCVCY